MHHKYKIVTHCCGIIIRHQYRRIVTYHDPSAHNGSPMHGRGARRYRHGRPPARSEPASGTRHHVRDVDRRPAQIVAHLAVESVLVCTRHIVT